MVAAAAGIVLALGLRAAFGWTGWLTAFFTAALLFILALTGWSFAVEGRRRAKDRFASTLIYASFVAAVVPLVLILGYIVIRGLPAFHLNFFTHSMAGVTPNDPGGGVYAALLGTLEQVGLAAVVALPIGLFTAIYLVEYGSGLFTRLVTFFVDVMTGVPSIVAGLFVYTFLLLGSGHRPFGAAGSLAAGHPDAAGGGARVGGDAQARPAGPARGQLCPRRPPAGARLPRSCCPQRSRG